MKIIEEIKQWFKIRKKKIYVVKRCQPTTQYQNPFDIPFSIEEIQSDRQKFEFYLADDREYISIVNGQFELKEGEYYFTSINTHKYCRKMGGTNLIFSYLILRLMECHSDSDFTIYLEDGVEVRKVHDESGIYIYRKIFDETNSNVSFAYNGEKSVLTEHSL